MLILITGSSLVLFGSIVTQSTKKLLKKQYSYTYVKFVPEEMVV